VNNKPAENLSSSLNNKISFLFSFLYLKDEIKTMESGNSTIQSSSDWTDALAVIEHLHKLLTS
jgi:hypothetical protein